MNDKTLYTKSSNGANGKINFVLLILVYCLFSFKINIIGGVGSGLRVDDLLIALILFIGILFYGPRIPRLKVKAEIGLFLLFVVWSIISTIINTLLGRINIVEGLLFSLRHIEYFVFLGVGLYLGKRNFEIRGIMSFYVIYITLLILLQNLGVIGVASKFSIDRASANTGGPWELAAVAAFLLLIFLFEYKNKFLAVTSFIILLMSASRITLIATLLILTFHWLHKKGKVYIVRFFGIFVILLALYVLLNVSYLFGFQLKTLDRINEFLNSDIISSVQTAFSNQVVPASKEDYFNLSYTNLWENISLTGDVSAEIRYYRWSLLLNAVFSDPVAWFFGLGPSFAGLAVDGYYIRLIAETGFIGLFIFILFIFALFMKIKRQKTLMSYLIVLLITGLFIDIFVTYKAMLLLWFFYGWYSGQTKILGIEYSNSKIGLETRRLL